MRREGRQHGLVRTHIILPSPTGNNNPSPNSRLLKAPATAGVFTKAPSKPTNHSKFTGKCCTKTTCASCNNLSSASRAKAKGAKGSKKFGLSSDLFDEYVDVPRFARALNRVDEDRDDE